MGGLSCHVWLVGSVEDTRRALLDQTGRTGAACAADEPVNRLRQAGTLVLDCRPSEGDRAGRAPGCAALVRQIVPWMLVNDPAGVRRNNLTVYVLASDLFARAEEDPAPSTLEPDMSRGELLRLAAGLSELLFAWGGNGAATVAFEHAEAADVVDQALIGELVRLLPPELVRLAVCSSTGQVPEALRTALTTGALRRDVAIPAGEPRAGRECA